MCGTLSEGVFQQFNPATEYLNDTTLSFDLKDPYPYDGVAAAPTDATAKIRGQVGLDRYVPSRPV